MNNEDLRQLVKIRHELRKLLPNQDQEAATRLLARMRALTSQYASESQAIEPEMVRWQAAFRLEL